MTWKALSKLKQGYDPKALPRVCMRCAHFRFEAVNVDGFPVVKSLRCGIGGFKVMKMGTCNLWELKANE